MNQLVSSFYDKFDKNNVLQEYPRPNLVRDSYVNLNGYWDYAITTNSNVPLKYDGRILVPFCIESLLSGVQKKIYPTDYLWYKRKFYASRLEEERVILHFGAVDQMATVYVNGEFVAHHIGGYLPFEVDITRYLSDISSENELIVMVRDMTDASFHARGKQKLKPSGMFYTPCSGIWQTVWMEHVPSSYIRSLRITPQLDDSKIELSLDIVDWEKEQIHVRIYTKDNECIYDNTQEWRKVNTIPISKVCPWSPEDPYLYTITISSGNDTIHSYFAMRKYSIQEDEKGVKRLFLNNKPYFHNGLLDQGYWPDGLYTAPSDTALAYDIKIAKSMGFNMLRKHAKIEPLRWYYHCDRIGMLVWQDMVNGGSEYNANLVTIFPNLFPRLSRRIRDDRYHLLSRGEEEGRIQFIEELKQTVLSLYHFPCIAMWVPFNEGWGQFDSKIAVKEIRKIDKTRTIDHASGWFDQKGGDVKSYHVYFSSIRFKKEYRAVVLSEFGGYIYHINAHSYSNKLFGYRIYYSKAAFTKAYEHLYLKRILREKKKYLCAAVYTQLTDVEEEVNGLITYDRKVIKIDAKTLRRINKQLMRDEE